MSIKLSCNRHNILVRVDANPSIGAGHLLRCLALSHSLKSFGVETTFLVFSNSLQNIRCREDFKYDYKVVPDFLNQNEEVNWIRLQAKSLNAQAIVLDGYQFSESYRRMLKGLNIPLILFDDENNSGQLYADIVINAVDRAFELGYSDTVSEATLLLGQKYTLLRPEFCSPPTDVYKKREECLITFGASDIAGLTLPVLKEVMRKVSGINTVTVVTGSAYPQVEAIKECINKSNSEDYTESKSKPSIHHRHSVTNMRSIFDHAAIAISAAGGTAFELAAMGVPSILVVVADNQLNAALEQQKNGWCVAIDARKCTPLKQIVSTVNELWNNERLRQQMHGKALCAATYNGAQNLAKEIMIALNLPIRIIN